MSDSSRTPRGSSVIGRSPGSGGATGGYAERANQADPGPAWSMVPSRPVLSGPPRRLSSAPPDSRATGPATGSRATGQAAGAPAGPVGLPILADFSHYR